MTRPTANEIRQQFIDYFTEKCGHAFVPSSPCVPHSDPTLMFTNAGMNQFKPIFLGTEQPKHLRVANTQKCIRAGGKHNDLDDVGHDTYHHTFFEMLGNWSFGDYFKKEAIAWAWDLLTNVWGLEKDRLHATFFQGDADEGLEPDTEARDLWKQVTDIDPTHVHPGGKKDNFWEMGETGPCGPCSEIHIDLTPDKSGAHLVNAGDPRVMEIWNLVFIQFNRGADHKLTPLPAKHVDTGMGFERITAILQGMAQGRLGEFSNYDTDLFTPIFKAIRDVTGAPAYEGLLESDQSRARQEAVSAQREGTPDKNHESSQSRAPNQSRDRKEAVGAQDERTPDQSRANQKIDRDAVMRDIAYRVIADHLRCLIFAITDGAVPDNEGRGYVLRRILRRAVRYGRQYLYHRARFSDKEEPRALCKARAAIQTPAPPKTANGHISDAGAPPLPGVGDGSLDRSIVGGTGLRSTEPFLHKLVPVVVETMSGAFPELKKNPQRVSEIIRDEEESFGKTLDRGIALFEHAADYAIKHHHGRISGEDAFKLHDTYGFPVDLTELMAEERGLTVNIGEYERLMDEARERARVGSTRAGLFEFVFTQPEETVFDPESMTVEPLGVLVFSDEPRAVGALVPGERGYLVLCHGKNPLYAEQGGQVGDTGVIELTNGEWRFIVTNTTKTGNTFVHHGYCDHSSKGSVTTTLPPNAAVPLVEGGPLAQPSSASRARACVDRARRRKITANHSSTHLLNWSLRDVLGDHVQQKGSLVDPEKTRFDLSHSSPISEVELARIEAHVNRLIDADLPVYAKEVPQADALKINGLRAVFGEKYPDSVRVVSIGAEIGEPGARDPNTLLGDPENSKWRQYSVEFCGGTHLKRTGEAGRFRLIEESAVAKGIRRVVGVTGERAKEVEAAAASLARQLKEAAMADDAALPRRIMEIAAIMNQSQLPIVEKLHLRADLERLQQRARQVEKQAAKAGAADALARVDELFQGAVTISGCVLVAAKLGDATIDQLRAASDALRSRAGTAAVFLAGKTEGKAVLLAAMTKDISARGIKAGDLIKAVAPIVGGHGGGRPDMAQGGGPAIDKIDEAVTAAQKWMRARLSG